VTAHCLGTQILHFGQLGDADFAMAANVT
jgi:hypothetical protein